ncbi:MAG: hypothetical protein J6Y01_07130, partial [Spirochaetales bacterium]|nr:hypothetical protein [Spirochaetales bacterium]
KTGKIIWSAILAAAVTIGCNDKNTKEEKMKEPNNKPEEIFHNEPVCIYGPPEMLGALRSINTEPEIDLPEPPDDEPTTDTNKEGKK